MRFLYISSLLLGALATVTAVAPHSYTNPCDNTAVSSLPFCDISLSPEARAADLVSRLTLEEKVQQVQNGSPAIDRLNIPKYQWWYECLHGVLSGCGSNGTRCPTSFPAGINNGASFNMANVKKMTQLVSTEARRLFVEGVINGLDFWAPNVNIFRDPRWGRGQETPGEDPVLSGVYAVNFVKGLQEGEDPNYLKAIATLKHYDAYSLESYGGVDRLRFDALVSDLDFVQTYWPAFKTGVIDGKVKSIMCSYNKVNGVPSCANEFLLQTVLRDEWGFDGYVVSDCDAVDNVRDPHHFADTPEEAVALSLKAGTDLDCGTTYSHLTAAVKQNLVDEATLDKSVTRLFAARMRVGLFDPLYQQPYFKYPAEVVDAEEHRSHALQMAKESLILLKNVNNSLPLSTEEIKSIAILGPFMNATDKLCSNYHGSLPHVVSPLEGISKVFSKSKIISDNVLDSCTSTVTDNFSNAAKIASSADVAILHVGIDGDVESEGKDRYSVGFPGVQDDLIKTIADAQTKTIVIVHGGSSIDLSTAKNHPNVVAIINALYPGEEGGNAIASVLSGSYNPSGRLPFTTYKSTFEHETDFEDMNMRSGKGRTYRFYTGEPVYEFGYGLSYSKFSYKWKDQKVIIPESENALLEMHYTVTVTNEGPFDGDVSVLAFVSRDGPSYAECPLKQLFDFDKVSLKVGESKDLLFSVSGDDAYCAEGGKRFADPGSYTVEIGDLSHSFNQPGQTRIYI